MRVNERFGFMNRKIDWDALAKLSPISPKVRTHLKNVYLTLVFLSLVAGVGSYMNILYGVGGFLTTILSVVSLISLYATPKEMVFNRFCLLGGFGLLQGVSLGPLINYVSKMDDGNSIIFFALAASISIFSCFSLAALFSERRAWLYMGGFLFNSLFLMCWISLINIFVTSSFLLDIQIYFGLVVFSLYVIFDTQLIIEKAENGDNDYVLHSIDLFLDLINIFVRILIALTKKKDNE